MTKKELYEILDEIAGRLEDAIHSAKSLHGDLQDMQTQLDAIPDQEDIVETEEE